MLVRCDEVTVGQKLMLYGDALEVVEVKPNTVKGSRIICVKANRRKKGAYPILEMRTMNYYEFEVAE